MLSRDEPQTEANAVVVDFDAAVPQEFTRTAGGFGGTSPLLYWGMPACLMTALGAPCMQRSFWSRTRWFGNKWVPGFAAARGCPNYMYKYRSMVSINFHGLSMKGFFNPWNSCLLPCICIVRSFI